MHGVKKGAERMSKYNNLQGWIRDVAELSKAEGGSAIRDRLAEVTEWLFDLVGWDDDDDYDETGSGSATDGDTLAVASNVTDVRTEVHGGAGGPAPGLPHGSTAASALDRALDGLAGKEREQAIAELDQLRMHSMGASGPRRLSGPRVNRGTR